VFGYIYVKMGCAINLCVKINSRIKSYKSQLQVDSILETKSIIFYSNQTRRINSTFLNSILVALEVEPNIHSPQNPILNPVGIPFYL